MSEEYWRAKIWGLLHDPVLKALHNNSGRGKSSFYKQLEVMKPWVETGKTPDQSGGKVLENILLADYIASASDRSAIGSVTASINYAPGKNREKGLEITHLLSGAKQEFKIKLHTELIESKRQEYLEKKEGELLAEIDNHLRTDIKNIKHLFWWLWRCLPEATCDLFKDNSLMLMPAETRLPDASIWSHLSMTSALAGALAGYDLTAAQIQRWQGNDELSHPYLAVFSFSPVQELIKSSRKMRDFWAGSWLLHYLSAKVCWKLANQYGPDTLLYPSLYQQPLIDHWLLQEIEKLKKEEKIDFDFSKWVKPPLPESLLTAGFPNVISLILPQDKVQAAMQTAQQTLLEEWLIIGDLVFKELHDKRHWMRELKPDDNSWQGWLKSQWQFYWTALPIGKQGIQLKSSAIDEQKDTEFQDWLDIQNGTYNLRTKENQLFKDKELDLLREAHKRRWKKYQRGFSANIGSWWGYIFDATRASLASVKNARNWELPTAFGPRSTISGIGPVVSSGKDGKDWITEGDTKESWEKHDAGFFDGTEQLNATEVVKRCLHEILPDLLGIKKEDIAASYPDLTSGVAGYLRVHETDTRHKLNFEKACQAIVDKYPDLEITLTEMRNKWGIPWMDKKQNPTKYHCRLLNAGWLVEDLQTPELNILQRQLEKAKEENKEEIRKQIIAKKRDYREDIQKIITESYPKNNPSDWYVLAAGDGDSMSEWLKGIKLKNYGDYIPSELSVNLESFPEFLAIQKRMGPSTHSALSRALLDFSNQLVPYLTQSRYAGRLIYGGGDDVLAYTNLWEWDKWLWDIRQCFKGAKDPREEFSNKGDYWQYLKDDGEKVGLVDRPLFTMGSEATISFGIVIAHHSVPLAIALESLWEAEKKAKDHVYIDNNGEKKAKDAVQVRVLYSNGNTLKSTAKFCVFHQWQQLITNDLESSIFEQAASLWSQHPAPSLEAIVPWTKAFCDRRDQFQNDEDAKKEFQKQLADFLTALFITSLTVGDKSNRRLEIASTQTKPTSVGYSESLDNEIQSWLKLAAFVKRNRDIKVRGEN